MFVSLFNHEVDHKILKATISFWNRHTHTFALKIGELCYYLLDVNEIAGPPTYGAIYDEHLPERSDMSDDLLRLLTEFKGQHYREEFTKKAQPKRYIPFKEWVKYYVKILKGSSSNGFATPANPFNLGGGLEVRTVDYRIHFEDVNTQGVSREHFMVLGLAMWLSSFVFPTGEGNAIIVETLAPTW